MGKEPWTPPAAVEADAGTPLLLRRRRRRRQLPSPSPAGRGVEIVAAA
jgi:hypothetical protein